MTGPNGEEIFQDARGRYVLGPNGEKIYIDEMGGDFNFNEMKFYKDEYLKRRKWAYRTIQNLIKKNLRDNKGKKCD